MSVRDATARERARVVTGLVLAVAVVAAVASGDGADHAVVEQALSRGLSTGDVDLLIRTGGECRVSNFLLWQSAYAELYFTETPWPDFTAEKYAEALAWYAGRERRFGRVSGQRPVSTDSAGNAG